MDDWMSGGMDKLVCPWLWMERNQGRGEPVCSPTFVVKQQTHAMLPSI
jgi:hypothetical protein